MCGMEHMRVICVLFVWIVRNRSWCALLSMRLRLFSLNGRDYHGLYHVLGGSVRCRERAMICVWLVRVVWNRVGSAIDFGDESDVKRGDGSFPGVNFHRIRLDHEVASGVPVVLT